MASVVFDKHKVYTIKSYKDNAIGLRMMSMGILPGHELRIIRKSPFGKCYFISAGSRWIATRHEELMSIEWSES